MGFSLSKAIGSITGTNAIDKGVATQAAYGQEAINSTKESRDMARADLAPYRDLGQRNISGLESLVTDPNAQLSFIEDNPFFKSLADEATRTLFNNTAAKGKVGSGGTAEALQNSILLLGNDLLNQNITQRQNLVSTGENAAAGSANATLTAGNSIADLYTGIGNAYAAGGIANANAKQALIGSGAQAGGTAAGLAVLACDERVKENIEKVGELDNGLPLYSFNYKNDPNKTPQINVMAQDVEKVNPDAVIEINGIKHIKPEAAWQ